MPPMGEGHQPVWVVIGGFEKWARAIGRKKPPSQHSVSPTDDDGIDSAVVDDRKYRQPHPGFGQHEGPRQELPGQGHDHLGTRRRQGEGRRQETSRPKHPRQYRRAEPQDTIPPPLHRLSHPQATHPPPRRQHGEGRRQESSRPKRQFIWKTEKIDACRNYHQNTSGTTRKWLVDKLD